MEIDYWRVMQYTLEVYAIFRAPHDHENPIYIPTP